MKKAGIIIFLMAFVFMTNAAEKLFLLAEDGFHEFLKKDFHELAFALSRTYECKLSSIPDPELKPMLRISTVKESGEYESILFALRGMVFYVNGQNPVKTLTSEMLKQITDGTFYKWTRTSVPIRQICYSGKGITPPAVPDKNAPAWVRFPNSDMAVQMVADDITALGIIPLVDAEIAVKGTKVLPVEGIMPTPQTVMSGKYPAAKRYYLSIRKDAPPEVRKLYQKLRSRQIKQKLWNAGILPVPEGD